MKVILLQDVKNLGKKGDIVETAEGYGRNYLLPRKMAKEANAANLNQAKQNKATEAHRAAQRKDEAVMLAAQLKKVHVIVKVRVGENGKMFGSVKIRCEGHWRIHRRCQTAPGNFCRVCRNRSGRIRRAP